MGAETPGGGAGAVGGGAGAMGGGAGATTSGGGTGSGGCGSSADCAGMELCFDQKCEMCAHEPAAEDCATACAGKGTCDAAGVCVIDCTLAPCGPTVLCPPGVPCTVFCGGALACLDKAIYCPTSGHACRVECPCSGGMVKQCCQGAQVHCGESRCSIVCGNEKDACEGAQIECGPNLCEATCGGMSQPVLTAAPAPNATCIVTPCP
jgi:hypothetical protein